MNSMSAYLLTGAILIELVQLILLAMFLGRRRASLRQLGRLANQLADGTRPASYYVNGDASVGEFARNLERLGTRLDGLQRRQQEEDFNLNVLLANMVEGVMVVDQRHIVRLVNNELLSLFDLKSSPLNHTILETLREARVEIIVREALATMEVQWQEIVLQSTSGQPTRHFEVSAVPIRTDKQDSGGVVLVFHDITRIKHLEVVRSEFVANVSHELRTPLAIFRGYLETLLDLPDLPAAERRRMLEAMRRHSERLNALVEDLLVLTRFESKQIEIEFNLVKPEPFFRQLTQDWQKRFGAPEVELVLRVAKNLPSIEIDPLRFEQVILNLLENAVAYSNPPRRINVDVGCQERHVEVRIRDNGIGIPPGDLPHVFERFYRVDKGRSRVSGGTGLGLSIVKHMVNAHHGTVRIESEAGQGTTVVLRLPLAVERVSSQPLPKFAEPGSKSVTRREGSAP